MINFGDLSPIAGANITEPVSKGKSIAMQAFKEGVMSIEKGIQEESAAMKAVADELYKSGKVDFMGKDVKEFAGFYKNKKKELVEALKPFSSVQAFLNNGGYDKIAEFKNEIENSDAYRAGVQNKLQYETIRALQAKGLSKFKFEDGKGLQNWLNGNSDIGFMGTYNHDQIDPAKWVQSRQGEKQINFSSDEVRAMLKTANYAPDDIETAVAAHSKTGDLFVKVYEDPDKGLKAAQLANTKANTESLINSRINDDNYKQEMLNLRKQADAYKQATVYSNWNGWTQNKTKIPYAEFQKPIPLYREDVVDIQTKQKLSGADADKAITKKEAQVETYIIDDKYGVLAPNAVGMKSNPPIKDIKGAKKNGEAYYDIRSDAWFIPAITAKGEEVTLVKPVGAQSSSVSKSNFMLSYEPNRQDWQAMQEMNTDGTPPPAGPGRKNRGLGK